MIKAVKTMDLGVTFALTGEPLVRITDARKRIQAGQYQFTPKGYRFSLADDGRTVQISSGFFIIKNHGIKVWLGDKVA